MLDACQKRWRFVHPLVLSDRELPRRRLPQQTAGDPNTTASTAAGRTIVIASSSRGDCSSNTPTPTAGGAEAKISAVDAARARYLQRKKA
jgi:hypothetical protein